MRSHVGVEAALVFGLALVLHVWDGLCLLMHPPYSASATKSVFACRSVGSRGAPASGLHISSMRNVEPSKDLTEFAVKTGTFALRF